MSRVKADLTKLGIGALASLVFVALVGCGGDSGSQADKTSFEKVSNFKRVITINDVVATGWKKGKTYDVEGLDGAESAYVGFWELPGVGSLNYEIRIYPSHEDAVNLGTRFAENSAGPDAALNSDDALWDEGVRDRRIIVGGGSRGSQNPRYGDYVILGNIVILCEGRTSEHSLDQCAPFVAQLKGEGA